MNRPPPDEEPMRAAFERGDLGTAATLTLEAYGPEILSFLVAYLKSESDGQEVFGAFAEDFWKGLSGFEWRTTLRAWAYTLARHAAIRFKTAAHRKPGRNLALSEAPGVSRVVASIRSRTAPHLRTETKSKMRELREQLPPDDQALIILRVDRGLSWRDIALVLGDGAAKEPAREEARLRKRFQLAKDQLRALARAAGLLDD